VHDEDVSKLYAEGEEAKDEDEEGDRGMRKDLEFGSSTGAGMGRSS
jgi:hypothetical protein